MNLEKIKSISIASYLQSIGSDLKHDFGNYGLYLSPYRKDETASLKVDYNKNLWCDYGANNLGGSIIDLVMKINSYSFNQAVDYLKNNHFENHSFSFHCKHNFDKNESQIIVNSVKEISNKYLIQYLHSRKISIETARLYCEEVYYENRGRIYYGIGFQNNSDGYELRNAYFKGCTSKDITILKSENSDNECFVFEGFFDFLSYLVIQDIKKINGNAVILNSVNNLNRCLPFLQSQKVVFTFLDNDAVGENATSTIQGKCKKVNDKSHLYADFKDLNEFLTCQNK